MINGSIRIFKQNAVAQSLICLESLYEAVARDTVGNTKVEFVITTNEFDCVGEGLLPALLARSKKQQFEETLDMLELLRQFRCRPRYV